MNFHQIKKQILLTTLTALVVFSFIEIILILKLEEINQFEWHSVSNNLTFSASPSIVIENRTYSLEAVLIEDHMPGIAVEGYKGTVKIIPADDLDFPEDLDLRKVWIIEEKGQRRAISKLFSSEKYFYYNALVKPLKNLPEWVLFGAVDVYVQLIYRWINVYYYLVDYGVETIVTY
ncbi:MAG: hypothetical protein ACFE9J_15555 [Candidatus Hermodarchaeota archaeon]